MTEIDALIGRTINGYEMLDVVGRGGMATVYRAQQVSMNRLVAVKVLPEKYVNDDTYIQRFEQEVAIVSKLEHRNIVPVHDYGEFNGRPYIVMRYMAGGSVDDMLDKGPLDIETIVNIIEQIAPALDYAHSKNVLHRDLKPSNVLMDDGGGAYLTDFGIARVLGDQGNKGITTQGVVGTPSYMSPEQAQGLSLDGRSDLYALGVMLFELSTGRRPFESDTPYGVAVMQVTAAPPSPRSLNPNLSLAIEEVILRSLRKKPDDRYQTAAKLSDALKMAANKPVMSMHDTQPGFKRPPQMAAAYVPPPAYTPNPPPTPAAVPSGYTNPYPRRKRRSSGNVWISAALGGLLGCGVLAVIVVTVLLILGSMGRTSDVDVTTTASVPDTRSNSDSLLPTLDPTSQSGRATLLPAEAEATPASSVLVPVGLQPTPTISPSVQEWGSALVYFAERDSNYDLFRLDLRTGEESQLTFDPAADSYPSVSPSGKQIAFQSDRDGDFDIYIMDADGSNLRQITDNTVIDRLPAWSPDGEWILFAADTQADGNFDLYALRPDGSALRLVYESSQRNSSAHYSPDGRYLVFTTGGAQDASTWDIGRLDTQTGDFIRLTRNTYKDWAPVFSPDGSNILYLTDRNQNSAAIGDSAIAQMTTDGNVTSILYDGPGYEWGVSFSPTGEAIAFTGFSSLTAREEIFVMRADGTEVQQVTSGGGLAPSWFAPPA